MNRGALATLLLLAGIAAEQNKPAHAPTPMATSVWGQIGVATIRR
jgi:hypothetical protein